MKLTVELSLPATDPAVPQIRRVDAGQKDWKFTTELQDGELYYRTKLNGSLTLSGDDFWWLYSQWERFSCCVEVKLNVYAPSCSGESDELFWPGYFLMTAVRWDFTACTAEVREILPRDGYDALYRIWTKQVDVINETQPLDNIVFTAIYVDKYIYTPNANGDLERALPDGNGPGYGTNMQEHNYSRGLLLMQVLGRVVSDSIVGSSISPFSFSVVSDFYTLPVNPVTGRKNLTKVIMAGSDAKRPVSITPAVKLLITLKDLLAELKTLHNVYHLIDPDTGQLRVEHYRWFEERGYQYTGKVTINLLKYPDALARANNESVDLENLYGKEEIVIANNSGSYFGEWKTGNVTYDAGCTVKDDKGESKTNTITASRIFTDLNAAYREPNSVPDDSIFLCDIVPKGTYPGYTSPWPQLALANNPSEYPGLPSSVLVLVGTNGYQSAALLFIDYHRHGRSFTAGRVNIIKQLDGSYSEGVSMAMNTTIPTRRQEGITIPLCCQDLPINLDGYIKTNRFEGGRLNKGTFDPGADTLTLDVIAQSRCQQTVVEPPDPGDDCPPNGTLLSGRTDQTYCDLNQEQVVKTYVIVKIYADGNCGSYEIPGPTIDTGNC